MVWAHRRQSSDLCLLRELVRIAPMVAAAGGGWSARQLPGGIAHLTDLPETVDLLRSCRPS